VKANKNGGERNNSKLQLKSTSNGAWNENATVQMKLSTNMKENECNGLEWRRDGGRNV